MRKDPKSKTQQENSKPTTLTDAAGNLDLNPIPPSDFDPDADHPQTLSRQEARANLLRTYISKNLPTGYLVAYKWEDDPLEYLRIEFENVVTHRKTHTDATYETLLKQSIRYLGEHVIKTLIQSDTDSYARD